MKKIIFGQFNTRKDIWLKEHIREFIVNSKMTTAYDPFAGNGDLLEAAREIGLKDTVGLDIDFALGWTENDSLTNIPPVKRSIIVTNPPYLTKYSAKRKGLDNDVKKYFKKTKYVDLYQIALENCLSASDCVVAIIPETFINSSFQKSRLNNITILEDNPFEDTECPVCVACFDKMHKDLSKVRVYKNDILIGNLGYYENNRLFPKKTLRVRFNDIKGAIALRAVDMPNPRKKIEFMTADKLDYDLKGIKESSRLITLISVKNGGVNINKLVCECNRTLNKYRNNVHDVLLSPFKGNTREGKRRRRLDYEAARAIIEMSYERIKFGPKSNAGKVSQGMLYN